MLAQANEANANGLTRQQGQLQELVFWLEKMLVTTFEQRILINQEMLQPGKSCIHSGFAQALAKSD